MDLPTDDEITALIRELQTMAESAKADLLKSATIRLTPDLPEPQWREAAMAKIAAAQNLAMYGFASNAVLTLNLWLASGRSKNGRDVERVKREIAELKAMLLGVVHAALPKGIG